MTPFRHKLYSHAVISEGWLWRMGQSLVRREAHGSGEVSFRLWASDLGATLDGWEARRSHYRRHFHHLCKEHRNITVAPTSRDCAEEAGDTPRPTARDTQRPTDSGPPSVLLPSFFLASSCLPRSFISILSSTFFSALCTFWKN